ncbi:MULTISPECIES: maltodextrin phosphorylase [unclassified Thermotoga]|uniref:maltodextrin phosphorylase n=1 Tax=unclassified Thermotoga TaxID=2631113 RepID=UPI000542DCE5|nr:MULTISPECIES: maltodextrin phosphorylase [unclassified Thermotoga]KAF2960172.1 alpha-glucan phosphorylase [Thermotoga sp. 38H-to]KHC91533.1 alpha-glucan phosphorylase [Thermotoga sp. Mc24]
MLEKLPENLKELESLAYNLWWSWSRPAQRLWRMIDSEKWEEHRNPVKILREVSKERLEELSKDEDFIALYELTLERFTDYMEREDTWFNVNYPEWDEKIVYMCMEYGLTKALPIYSGGLGILAGDHLKSASDLGLPLIAVGLLYKHGYFTQQIDSDGRQIEIFPEYDIEELPMKPLRDEDGNQVIVEVPIDNDTVKARVFEVQVGRVKLYLLDTDFEENEDRFRKICDYLYNPEPDVRVSQEILLGIGGMKLLKTLKIKPGVIHLNEGHPAFSSLERIKSYMEEGYSFTEALEIVRQTTVFTTHTPVPAGHDRFPFDFVEKKLTKFFEGFESKELLMNLGRDEDGNFNMTYLALRTSSFINGVSKLHADVSRRMFKNVWKGVPVEEIPIEGITNGVHMGTWINREMRKLFDRYLGRIWREHTDLEGIWYGVDRIPDEELWEAHLNAKKRFIDYIRESIKRRNERLGIDEPLPEISENALIIGFARRFATYKRAVLLFSNLERLKRIVNNPERPVYIVYAGKAHPRDEGGKEFLRRIYKVSQMPDFKNKIIVLENYDIGMARLMVSGVDVWLNNPRRPMEASGTSGMKAAANGVLNASVYDGWWVEGYNGRNGWVIGDESVLPETEVDDPKDAEALYELLENEIIPTYYENREKWVLMMKESIKSVAPKFSTTRMLKEYTEKFYIKGLLNREWLERRENVEKIGAWKERILKNWENVSIERVVLEDSKSVEVTVRLGDLTPDDVLVELMAGRGEGMEDLEVWKVIHIRRYRKKNDLFVYTYNNGVLGHLGSPGWFYAVRVIPYHPRLPIKFLPEIPIVWKKVL